MQPIREAATNFLSHRRIAVTGVSRDSGSHGSNAVYKRLREKGYEVFAVNPNAWEVEGDPAYPNLASIPVGVDAVLFLPWVVGAWVWESSLPPAARGLLVGGVAWANIYTFSPWKPFA